MIKTIEKKGLNCPLVVCDACGEPILKAEGAWVISDWDNNPFYFVHGGECDRRLRMPDGHKYPLSTELNVWLFNLMWNTGMRTLKQWKDANETSSALNW